MLYRTTVYVSPMTPKSYKFGATSRMRDVPLGEHAIIQLADKGDHVETDWGEKVAFNILLFSHPSYESIPQEGLATKWESKSVCATQLYQEIEMSHPKNDIEFLNLIKNGKWKLMRTQEGTYFIENI